MTIGKVTIQYGFSEVDKYTHIKFFSTGDTSDKTGGGGSVANLNTGAAPVTDVNDLLSYTVLYLRALEEVVQPGVKVLLTSQEQFSDAVRFVDRLVIHTALTDFPDFAAAGGNTGKAGPRGRAFVGGRQKAPDTNRYGWLRFHYIAGNLMDLPTIFEPSDVSSAFATYYGRLRVLGSSIASYRTLSSVLHTYQEDIPLTLPSASLHMGVRNG